MIARRNVQRCVALACVVLGAIAPRTCQAITLNQPGWYAFSFTTVPLTLYAPSDVELDAAGNLYVPTQPTGVRKITSTGDMTLWSTAPAVELALKPGGGFYAAGSSFCNCIETINPDASYSPLHQDALEWIYVELSPSDTLYAVIWAGSGQGVYRIDRSTGPPTIVHAGGPGPGGDGTNFDIAFGLDGRLYMVGDDAGAPGTSGGLFRLDGPAWTKVAPLPHGGMGLTRDPAGLFYTFAANSEVWMIDVTSGTSSLLASQISYPQALGYDPVTQRLYVVEGGGQIWIITKDPTQSVARESWGALKARYRGDGVTQPAPHDR